MKIITLDQVPIIKGGRVLVTTNGSFDVLHVAHLRILQESKIKGYLFLVLLISVEIFCWVCNFDFVFLLDTC